MLHNPWCVNDDLVALIEYLNVVGAHDEVGRLGLLVEDRQPVPVPLAQRLLLRLLRVDDLRRQLTVLRLDITEHVFRVKELWIDFVGSEVALAHHEYLGGLVSGRGRLGGVHLLEKLAEHPDEALVVLGAEHFGDEPAALAEEAGGKLKGVEGEEGLLVRVVDPVLADVGSSVVQNKVGLCRL